MPLNAAERENAAKISPLEEIAHKALVVGRDNLTAGLLADVLIRNLGLDAAVMPV